MIYDEQIDDTPAYEEHWDDGDDVPYPVDDEEWDEENEDFWEEPEEW